MQLALNLGLQALPLGVTAGRQGLRCASQLIGETLGRWLGRAGLNVLASFDCWAPRLGAG